jgi:hypothetical protein
MKRFVDLLGAFLTALALCILPARADVIAGPMIAVGLLGIVLIFAVVAVAASLLVRAIGRLRAKRKDEEQK